MFYNQEHAVLSVLAPFNTDMHKVFLRIEKVFKNTESLQSKKTIKGKHVAFINKSLIINWHLLIPQVLTGYTYSNILQFNMALVVNVDLCYIHYF